VYLEGIDWEVHGQHLSGSGLGQIAGFCECGNKLPCSIKFREFLDYLRTCYLLRKDCVPGVG
jgi:hypothetical protein